MALAWTSAGVTSATKDKVALLLYSTTYTALGTGPRQSLIDGEGASALVEIETFAQWFTLTTATGNAPDEWEPWFVTKIVGRIERNAHPDRAAQAQAQDDRAMFMAMDSYSRKAVNYSPSGSEAFVYHTLNNRIYVLNHCIRMPRSKGERMFFPTIDSVDAALEEILNTVWTGTEWLFARRPVRIVFTRTAFTGMTWTESTKTLATTGVSTSLPVGSRFYLTGGTGATVGEYAIGSTTSTTMVLSSSIGSAADGQTDLAGFYVVPVFHGLNAGESLQAIASTRFIYTDSGHESDELLWLGADNYARSRAVNGSGTGRPRYFRAHQPSASAMVFVFSPPPDADYTVQGEVIVNRAASPTSTTDTIPFASFASEFMPGVRRAQLDRVLTNYGRTNAVLRKEVEIEMSENFPNYQDPGAPDTQEGITDVYRDRAVQQWPYGFVIGEGI